MPKGLSDYLWGIGVAFLVMVILPNEPVTASELSYAEMRCKANGGVVWLRPGKSFIYNVKVHCGNGAEFKFTRKEAIEGIFEPHIANAKAIGELLEDEVNQK